MSHRLNINKLPIQVCLKKNNNGMVLLYIDNSLDMTTPDAWL